MIVKNVSAKEFELDLVNFLREKYIHTHDQRGELPSRSPGWKRIDFANRRGICFHHSASNNGSWAAYARAHLQRWEKAGGIAYTAGIAKDGSFHIFNDFDRKGYAQGYKDRPGDENAMLMGVLVDGSFHSRTNKTYVNPTIAQMQTIMVLVEYFSNYSAIGQVAGHFMFGKDACPGDWIRNVVIECNRLHLDTIERIANELPDAQHLIQPLIEQINMYNVLDLPVIETTQDLQLGLGVKPDGLFYSRSTKAFRDKIRARKEYFDELSRI